MESLREAQDTNRPQWWCCSWREAWGVQEACSLRPGAAGPLLGACEAGESAQATAPVGLASRAQSCPLLLLYLGPS